MPQNYSKGAREFFGVSSSRAILFLSLAQIIASITFLSGNNHETQKHLKCNADQ
jgi:hypothetical protein